MIIDFMNEQGGGFSTKLAPLWKSPPTLLDIMRSFSRYTLFSTLSMRSNLGLEKIYALVCYVVFF